DRGTTAAADHGHPRRLRSRGLGQVVSQELPSDVVDFVDELFGEPPVRTDLRLGKVAHTAFNRAVVDSREQLVEPGVAVIRLAAGLAAPLAVEEVEVGLLFDVERRRPRARSTSDA